MLFYIFCFKQKTAYEMRISDWSSDVCSSDLAPTSLSGTNCFTCTRCSASASASSTPAQSGENSASVATSSSSALPSPADSADSSRSEEHTSELQSLMRISYAVFCLKKKKEKNKQKRQVYNNRHT